MEKKNKNKIQNWFNALCVEKKKKGAMIINTFFSVNDPSEFHSKTLVIRVLGRASNSSVVPHKYHSRIIPLISYPTYIF